MSLQSDYRSSHQVGSYSLPKLTPLAAQLPEKEVVLRYCPRKVFAPYHARKQRFALTVAHRRAGKTVAEVIEGICRLGEVSRGMSRGKYPGRTVPPQVAFVSPSFGMSKRNAWPYAKQYASAIPGVKVMEGDLTLHFPGGGKFIFAGSDNHESLRGLYLDHVSLDEFGSQDPRVWGEIVRPALSDYAGSATFIGSAHGRNHFYDLLKQHQHHPEWQARKASDPNHDMTGAPPDPDWMIAILKASETKILSDAELKDARATMTEAQYRQEYECDFDAAVTGTFYGKEIELADTEKRIGFVPHERASDTYAGWDLGLGGATAIWVYQRVGQEWRFIAYYEGFKPDSGLEDACDWLKTLPFKVVEHFLPHDAEVKELRGDRTSRKEFLEARGLSVTVLPRKALADGINTVRVNFNHFFFDRNRCEQGLDCLRMYRSQYDETKKVFSDKPVHDWASHAADALRYSVMGMPDAGARTDWSKPLKRNLEGVV